MLEVIVVKREPFDPEGGLIGLGAARIGIFVEVTMSYYGSEGAFCCTIAVR